MGGNLRSGKTYTVLCRGAAGAIAICFGSLPILAGQDQQGRPAPTTQQTVDYSAPGGAPQGPPPSYQQLPPTLTLPAGTLLTVRVSQLLSSEQNQPGDSFGAELEKPLVVDGWVVARRGQTLLGRVAVAQRAGRVKGVSQLGVELSQLALVDGQQLPIRTQLQETSAGASHGADAAAIATTTGLGAAIGAAAHGGEGAGIGAAIGAAAGVSGVLLTRGRPTVIPPETLLTFQLEYPVTFSTQRSGPAFRPVTQEDYDAGTALRRRSEHFAVAPAYPAYPYPTPLPYYGAYYYGWGYYPPPLVFGYYSYGPRFGRFERGRFRH